MTFLDKINKPRPGLNVSEDPEGKGSGFIKSTGTFIIEIIKVIVISLAIIIPVRYFLIQPFYVSGASMEPSFYDNEYLVIDEISYRFSEPERGDIIVFRYPENPSQFFIKRVIGLPGEEVEIRNGYVLIYNEEYPRGIKLDETEYLAESIVTPGSSKTELKDGEYFVMGDNREQSLDSRKIGPITEKDIVGRTWLRAWPFSKWRVFHAPSYDF